MRETVEFYSASSGPWPKSGGPRPKSGGREGRGGVAVESAFASKWPAASKGAARPRGSRGHRRSHSLDAELAQAKQRSPPGSTRGHHSGGAARQLATDEHRDGNGSNASMRSLVDPHGDHRKQPFAPSTRPVSAGRRSLLADGAHYSAFDARHGPRLARRALASIFAGVKVPRPPTQLAVA